MEAAREWLNNYKPQISEDDIRERQVDDATPAITDDVEGALNLLKLAKCAEGKWDYVIGLVASKLIYNRALANYGLISCKFEVNLCKKL